MVRPATQFCCGLSLKSGMQVILGIHLLLCLMMLMTSVTVLLFNVNLFDGMPAHSSWSHLLTALSSFWGVFFIVGAFAGIKNRAEPFVRVYLYYFALVSLIDIIFIVSFAVMHLSCSMGGGGSGGNAFGCGVHRVTNVFGAVLGVVIQVYIMWVIWSFCEDMREVGSSAMGLGDLTAHIQDKRRSDDAVLDALGVSAGPYPVDYGSLSGPGVGGGKTIFGGSKPFHEVRYPAGPW
eukprot:CAMPEP_0204271926 /NCGR_PEP_ID=MMETSP0468-20130131/21509_1 /ASSEMBLY_ACC=CAM_ASM_000383 /TAXON_ID=2969 /ORGANISM="Oxyrrhis marina" /LENGTH=234 /DNA_ID=CAMNT_0051247705 /DNA_START=127 /DNA_END=831 /DNA_ORIENTATION=+